MYILVLVYLFHDMIKSFKFSATVFPAPNWTFVSKRKNSLCPGPTYYLNFLPWIWLCNSSLSWWLSNVFKYRCVFFVSFLIFYRSSLEDVCLSDFIKSRKCAGFQLEIYILQNRQGLLQSMWLHFRNGYTHTSQICFMSNGKNHMK